MSSPDSSPVQTSRLTKKKVPRSRATRSPSASEIARNINHFETWSTHQRCEQVCYSDIPPECKADVQDVFNVAGRLPLSWTDNQSKDYELLTKLSTSAFMDFIQNAYTHCPTLFSDNADRSIDIPELYAEMSIVFFAWRRMQWMQKSKERWSEAEYVANVYNVFRSPAIRESVHRVHCTISLPQPLQRSNMSTQASRILNTKTAIPDGALMIPAASIRLLSHSAHSPYKVMKGHTAVVESGSASKGSSFRYQSTPCENLPEAPCFEFVSSFWEDKKPVHQLLEHAYRQNRMSTASALRHLHSLHISAPVFGLVWASGTVRAHVDWWKVDGDKPPVILSAPYPGASGPGTDIFHEWKLEEPSDILAVYFVIRNLDRWTSQGFRDRVVQGVGELVDSVVVKGGRYRPWKRAGELTKPSPAVLKENMGRLSLGSDSMISISPKNKPRKRRPRLS